MGSGSSATKRRRMERSNRAGRRNIASIPRCSRGSCSATSTRSREGTTVRYRGLGVSPERLRLEPLFSAADRSATTLGRDAQATGMRRNRFESHNAVDQLLARLKSAKVVQEQIDVAVIFVRVPAGGVGGD